MRGGDNILFGWEKVNEGFWSVFVMDVFVGVLFKEKRGKIGEGIKETGMVFHLGKF